MRGPNPLEPRQESGQAPTPVRGKRSEASERVPTAGGDPTTLLNRFAEELRRAQGGVYEGGNVRMFECEKVVLELEA